MCVGEVNIEVREDDASGTRMTWMERRLTSTAG